MLRRAPPHAALLAALLLSGALPLAAAQVPDHGDTTVYVTKDGPKYHTADCPNARPGAIAIKLREAAKAYTACPACNPPALRDAEHPAKPERPVAPRPGPRLPLVEAPPKDSDKPFVVAPQAAIEPPKAAERPRAPADSVRPGVFKVQYLRVVDGTTLVVNFEDKEEQVRLLCVEPAEKEQADPQKSAAALAALLENQDVYLEFDPNLEKRDKSDRLQAWVWADEALVNREMVRMGHAKLADQSGLGLYGDRLKKP
jgi:endonuclease YncB( thermonuclease family)